MADEPQTTKAEEEEPLEFFHMSHEPEDRNAPVGVALIGCGYWGRNYARVLTELPDVGHVVACDSVRSLLQEVKSRHGDAITCADDLSMVLSDPMVDAVIVATPPSSHAEVVAKCIAAGKHVLVEKPFTVDDESAEELLEQVASEEVESESRVILMVGHTFLFNSAVHKMKEILESDAFGKPYYFHATRTNLGPVS
jgi:predicted dehydrogenase